MTNMVWVYEDGHLYPQCRTIKAHIPTKSRRGAVPFVPASELEALKVREANLRELAERAEQALMVQASMLRRKGVQMGDATIVKLVQELSAALAATEEKEQI